MHHLVSKRISLVSIYPSIPPPTHNTHTPQSEFRSAVADMKNSVASRENAQCSCAAQFIGAGGFRETDGGREGFAWSMCVDVHVCVRS